MVTSIFSRWISEIPASVELQHSSEWQLSACDNDSDPRVIHVVTSTNRLSPSIVLTFWVWHLWGWTCLPNYVVWSVTAKRSSLSERIWMRPGNWNIDWVPQIALWNQIAIEPSDLLLTKSWRCYDIMIKRDDRSTAALLPCSASHVRCRCFPWRDGDWHPNINFSVWPIQPAGVRIL